MIPAAAFVIAGVLLDITASVPDTALQVGYDQTITIPAEGATAAYAIDASVAEAAVGDNAVRVHGKAAGTTAVVVVTPSSVVTVRVTVSEPPLVLPTGFRRGIGGSAAEGGTAELRYVSDPGEISTILDLRRQEAERAQRLRIVTANPIGANGAARAAIPFFSYQRSTPGRDITLFDQAVTNSPLTLNGDFVRGLHVRQGPWSFHGGVTSVALFQNAFFSTAPEYVAGITREFHFGPDQTLAANAYSFRNAPEDRVIASNGGVVSLMHTYRSPVRNLLLRSELGVSRGGVAAAAQASREEPGLHLAANVRYEPPKFPSLAISNLHGLFADFDLMRARSAPTSVAATAVVSDYRVPQSEQRNIGASTTVSRKVTQHLSAVGGALFSSFHSDTQQFDLKTLSLPFGADYAWKHAYAGVRDQPTTDFNGRIANGYSMNAGASLGHFSLSGFFRHDVDLPAVTTLFFAVPGLQEALERSGIFIARPAQLIALLRDAGLLARLGFTTPLELRLAPARNDAGLNADWFSARQRLTVSYLRSDTQLVNDAYQLRTTSVSYTRSLLSGTELAAFITWGGTVLGSDHPVFGALVREPVDSLSRHLLPGTRGDISGHVFRDDEVTAKYSPEAKPFAGVEVQLDDARVVRTDTNGVYAFHGVASGIHRLEAKLPTTEKFFFTTDSPAYSDINAVVDFGVSFVRGVVFGQVVNDAGQGIDGVGVTLDGGNIHRKTVADAGGEFRFNAVPDGAYVVATAPDTYPTGYDLSSLAEVRVEVKSAEPVAAKIVANALRSVAGTVTTLDERLHKEVPVSGATVGIRELGLTAKTNEAGKYLLRRVPAGAYTIVASTAAGRRLQGVVVPAEPGTVVADKLTFVPGATAQVAELAQAPPPPIHVPAATPAAAPAPPTSGGFAEAVKLVTDESFRDALAVFEHADGAMTPQDRYFYAVALYETGHYREAKRQFAAAQPPDTSDSRRYAAKIAGAIPWTE